MTVIRQREMLAPRFSKTASKTAASSIVPKSTASSTSGFRPSSSTPQIDYRQLGIPDAEQKRSFLGPMVIVLLASLIAIAFWVLMRG
jgi:hypothetical protein